MNEILNILEVFGVVALVGLWALLCVAIVKTVTRPKNAFVIMGEYRSLVEREQYGPTRYRERL